MMGSNEWNYNLIYKNILRKLSGQVKQFTQKVKCRKRQFKIDRLFIILITCFEISSIQSQILIKQTIGIGYPEGHLVQDSSNSVFPVLLLAIHWLYHEAVFNFGYSTWIDRIILHNRNCQELQQSSRYPDFNNPIRVWKISKGICKIHLSIICSIFYPYVLFYVNFRDLRFKFSVLQSD